MRIEQKNADATEKLMKNRIRRSATSNLGISSLNLHIHLHPLVRESEQVEVKE
jgi:hypothetical protein